MGLIDDAARDKLAAFVKGQTGAESVAVTRAEQLGGGAVQENYAVDLEIAGGPKAGSYALVLRTDAPSHVAVSLSRANEFAILSAAYEAGVMVPEPLWLCPDKALIGRPFYFMRRAEGVAHGHKLVRDMAIGGDRVALAERLGRELARIHTITPQTHRFDFLTLPEPTPALAGVREYRGYLDGFEQPHPGFEWGLRWLERNAPEPDTIVLAHGDYRTGNYMVDAKGLTAILDWEFAGWGEPHQDLGWLCAKCWRFGAWAEAEEAGGIAPREPFYRGYEQESGRKVDRDRVYFWEVYAHMRWGIIALQQGMRHLSGEEPSLNLALTGRLAAEMEAEILRMTPPGKVLNWER